MSVLKRQASERITLVVSPTVAADIRLRARAHAVTTSQYCAGILTGYNAGRPMPAAAALAELFRALDRVPTSTGSDSTELVGTIRRAIELLLPALLDDLR